MDKTLHEYISKNVTAFSSFRIVRYVDDMYILISSDKPIGYLHDAYNEIRNEYSSILKNYGFIITMLIGIIGAVVLIGGGIALFLFLRKKKQA